MAPIKTIGGLVRRVVEYNPQADTAIIEKAYAQAASAHQGQHRHSGEPFVKHPLSVADILTQLRMDVPSIVAGLLHDTLEDTQFTLQQIEENFGRDIARLVDGVTKIDRVNFRHHEEKQAENFRKMILFMADDIRVILIKLSDRLHNMRTIGVLPVDKRLRIARETLEIYAPLANRLGIGWMKSELEDHCFHYVQTDAYEDLTAKVSRHQKGGPRHVQKVIETIRKDLAESGISGTVSGRKKHLYGIYLKMQKRKIPFEEVYDLLAVRIITDTKMNCYSILGLIHSLWRPVPGRFKDFIGVPKSNLYQSLHTTVVGSGGEYVEFQIRTEEMHQVAEHGIAAHWRYKEKGQVDEQEGRLFSWLQQFLEWHQDLSDNRQFIDSVKRDLFPDVVYVFTTKGEVKELLRGSTPIDFAYSIHTEVGQHCSSAKVNGRMVPLRYELRSGDSVEIITSQNQTPSKDWLRLVRTSRAKAKIKQWVRQEAQEHSLDLGQRILERALKKEGMNLASLLKSGKLTKVLADLKMASSDQLLVAVGYGRVSVNQVLNHLFPERDSHKAPRAKSPDQVPRKYQGIRIQGVSGILIRLGRCCHPVPGDRIIGFITRGRGLTIHSVACSNIDKLDYDRDRIVEVDWDPDESVVHPVRISVLAIDQPGMLASVSASISETKTNISHARIKTNEEDKAVLNFEVEIRDTKHLARILKGILQVKGVLQAKREF